MAKAKLGKNTLPLLALTALLLSVALVNYDQLIVSNINNTQSVLSESDERDEDEDRSDEDEKDEELESRNKTTSRNREAEMVEKREENKRAEQKTIKVEEEIEIEEEGIDDDQSKDGSLENEVETEFEEETETVSGDGTVNRFKLKIKTKTVAGKTIVETASGEVEVENSPEDVINSLVENGLIDDPTSFEAKVNSREKVEFEIQGTDSKRFLGIFKIVIPKLITVSSETGEIVSTNQNTWSRILSLLSI